MLIFYDAPWSGNTWKVRLVLKQLAIPHESRMLDLFKGEARSKEFRALNPFGRVPYVVDEGLGLAESNAILLHVARNSRLPPEDPKMQALVEQWMFFEQNQVELNIGIPRLWKRLGQADELAKMGSYFASRATAALKVLERHLSLRDWLVHDGYSVSDIALCAYTQLAPEAGHDLAPFPAVS